tara:strand:- start:2135 stop:2509 length:375 start_codon:yes stop_codon:yes gene_type:complete
MAYSTTLNYVVGDMLPALDLTLRDKNTAASGATLDSENSATWAPINITGATVRLRLRELGSTTIVDTRTFSITNPTGGACTTNFSASTFPKAGTYEGEIEITFSDNSIQTVYDLVKFKVRDDFD